MATNIANIPPDPLAPLKGVVERHWGYRTFRPLQEEAMIAMLAAHDSLVVMPTGGGKSLCYQAPAIVRSQSGGGATVVVSPLISLMKDQVDSLRANGVAAAQIDSSLSAAERSGIFEEMRQGVLPLLFVSPERLVKPDFQQFLRDMGVRSFAIDEAHCISQWGHDFRPEYRQLSHLKQFFPGASVHAFTATATPHVRADIIHQLDLQDPAVLVGNFDRPNLVYRVVARRSQTEQIVEVLERHKDEGGIIYCIRRKDVDEVSAELNRRGYKSLPYHAGLTPEQRKRAQEAFTGRGKSSCDLIVATVAFGMGIDRSNIRFVLHIAMPKSIEAYQQETGRAGRDGLEAECILLYSGQDGVTWRSIVERSAAEAEKEGVPVDPAYVPTAMKHLDDMDRYARSGVCRHQSLVEYFGQKYLGPENKAQEPESAASVSEAAPHSGAVSCAACDVCMGENEQVPDAIVIAQKILSCVARVDQRFGIGHVISILRGENIERVRKFGHERLPTFGLLKGHDKAELRDYVYQLLGQKVLVQEGTEYPILRLNAASWEVMKKLRGVRLVESGRQKQSEKRSRAETVSWEGVDQELFDTLRAQRREIATERGVPPYVIFSDATLRELARNRPSTLERMRLVYGIGETKLRDFGARILPVIEQHCRTRQIAMDVADLPGSSGAAAKAASEVARPLSAHRAQAFGMFRSGASLDEVAAAIQKARSTVSQYLVEYIQAEQPPSVAAWVSDRIYEQVREVAKLVGKERLKPIFVGLGEKVSYEEVRVVVAHLKGTP